MTWRLKVINQAARKQGVVSLTIRLAPTSKGLTGPTRYAQQVRFSATKAKDGVRKD